MTIGTAIVIVMLLYLLDKHGLLRRAAVVVAGVAGVTLVWIAAYPRYEGWQEARLKKTHKAIETQLIAKYHNAVPDPPPGYSVDSSEPISLEQLDKIGAANGNAVMRSAICKESSFQQLTEVEQDEVIRRAWPNNDMFDRAAFLTTCRQ